MIQKEYLMVLEMKYLISSKRINGKHDIKDKCDPAYSIYFDIFNIELEAIPNLIDTTSLKDLYTDDFDGIILSGSGDIKINDDLVPENKSCQYSKERDNTENFLIELAVERKKPLIGICHGMQKINEYFGGILSPYYHCKPNTYSEQGIEHNVSVNHEFLDANKEYIVNQYHDHCILEHNLAKNMKIFAIDPRFNTVEGFCNMNMRILCMQWHPERSISDNMLSNTMLEKFI